MNTTSSDLLAPRRRTIHENLDRIKESLGEIAHVERERLTTTCEQGVERVEGAVEGAQVRFETYVREKPLRSLLFAAGTGAFLGLLLGRRR
jgi:ElaB/YqjD/DUF883 family membrane-anchored ribosome-binding protein